MVAFLDWLTEHQLTLGSCEQSDLDRWLTDAATTRRGPAGHFIRWAHKNKLTSVRIGAHRWLGPTRPLDDQHRWNIARRLLHDDKLKPDDRLAGLLVLLYAQTPAAICRMTIVDVETEVDPVRLHLGSSPIHLPEPVADLARLVSSNRKGHATIGALTPSIWLFPGGQPGRPISTGQLTQRLNRLGIRPAPLAAPRCSSSPPRSRQQSWPAPSVSTPTSPSPGNDSPPATGQTTPLKSAAGHTRSCATASPGPRLARPCWNHGHNRARALSHAARRGDVYSTFDSSGQE